ncbi:hypothetical protein [Kribbella sp. NPDC048915]|uniref:sunset domain-containing protein n=1 Tax=Kribbella sp. NPDC048915 TaxID=3155148 RepID=UPI0033C74025
MSWLLRDNWLGSLLAFLVGAGLTWYLLDRRPALTTTASTPPAPAPDQAPPATTPTATATPTPHPAPDAETALETVPELDTGTASVAHPTPVTAAAATPPPVDAPTDAAPTDEAPSAGDTDSSGEDAPSTEPAAAEVVSERRAEFSRLMDGEPTLFDDVDETPAPVVDVPPGKYGEGSADAVPHQGPPDGFTIKGNGQSMLFHTPDSPYYGRTKPEVWFRTEADAERAGFTKYVRRPRKST